MTKFGLWIDTCSSTDNSLHGRGRAMEKSSILLQIEKAVEISDGDLTLHMFFLKMQHLIWQPATLARF